MHRFSPAIAKVLRGSLLAVFVTAILSSAPALASAQEGSVEAKLQVRATVLATCSVATSAAGQPPDLSCSGAADAAPAVETGSAFDLENGAGSVAVTTVNF